MTGNDFERFTHGAAIGVDVAGIERELATLWREAAQGSNAVMRACAWNLVVLAEGDQLARGKALSDQVIEHTPSRAIVIHAARDEGKELNAYVSARCRMLPGGGKMLCTEEITLEARGAGADYLPSLTRALLVPDLPSAVLCPALPPESALVDELVGVSDRVIFDSRGLELESLRHLGPNAIDLAWLRLGTFQLELARALDGRGRVTAAQVFAPRVDHAEGRWLCAWLHSRLSFAASLEEGPLEVRFTLDDGTTLGVTGSLDDEETVLVRALSPRVLTPAWAGARDALQWAPAQGTAASWSDFTRRFVETANAAIAERGRFTCALTGGSAVKMYALLAKAPLDWSKIDFFFSDERLVPLESPDSNYKACREAMPQARLHPVRTLLSPEAAAQDYARLMPTHFDLVHLGMGPDGHVASLFPGHKLLGERHLKVAAIVDSPKPPLERVTFTLPTLAAAREVWFLISGEAKKPAANAARNDPHSQLPAAIVHRVARRSTWFLDL